MQKQHIKTKAIQKQPAEVFYKKAAPKNFTIFTGNHLCWRLFLIKLQAYSFKKIYFEELMRRAASGNSVKAVQIYYFH